jgi:hypothetical protein
MNESPQSRKTNLFVILGAIFLTNAILAEIIGVKIFFPQSLKRKTLLEFNSTQRKVIILGLRSYENYGPKDEIY